MAAIGMAPLSDNSFLTHLATGRLIVDDWHIPRSDPYSFTAQGEPWVVQSWLASVVYGLVDQVAGLGGVRILMGILMVGIFAVAWRLTAGVVDLVPRVAVGALVVGVGITEWSERPLLIGLLALALTILCAEGGLDARWLVPVGWIWVNSHGSFPLGIAYLVVAVLGRRLDGEAAQTEARALRWLGAGVLLGVVGPLGPAVLLFPVQLLGRQEILRNVIEWQSPGFESLGERVFLLQTALGILAVARSRSQRDALLLAVFLVAALLGSRNIVVASLVLVPVLARGAPQLGVLRSERTEGLARPLAALGVAALVAVPIVSLGSDDLDLDSYPVALLDGIRSAGVDLDQVRLVAPDRVGNLVTLREGPGSAVFFDDRFDMYPTAVSEDALALSRGSPRSLEILEAHRADLVLVRERAPLRGLVGVADQWRERAVDGEWVLYCRRGADLGGRAGTC